MNAKIDFPSGAHGLFSSILTESVKRIQYLQEAAKAEERVRQVVLELDSYVTEGWPIHAAHLWKREEGFIRQRFSDEPVTLNALEQLADAAQQMSSEVMRRYPALLERACAAAELLLHHSSRHPEYFFDKRFFRLKVEKTEIAVLSDYERQLSEFPADIGAVIGKVKKEHVRVFDRPFDGAGFLKQLRSHYLGVLSREGHPDGTHVPVRRIASRVTSEKRGYMLDEFLIDLSRLARNGPLEVDQKRLEVQETTDVKRGMLLHDVGTLGYIGSIRFREVK